MSFDNAIFFKKEKRKPHRGAKSTDSTCRNNGSCLYCRKNRMYQVNKEHFRMDELENERKKEINNG